MASGKNIFNKIKDSNRLPSPPQVLLKLLAVCDEKEATPKQISHIMAKDPALVAKVLKLVNSPYIGLRSKVDNLDRAVVYLGVETIKNIVISASVVQTFAKTRGDFVFDLTRFWWHSFSCACLARRIAKQVDYPLLDEAFLSGLLHDIGKLILWINFKKEYSEILEKSEKDSLVLPILENQLGTTHAEAGFWMIQQWQLKSFMADAVRYHHDDIERIDATFPLVKILYTANVLCEENKGTHKGGMVAQKIFNFTTLQVEEICNEARQEALDVAKSFQISIKPPDPDGKQVKSNQDQIDESLLDEVKYMSLTYGTLSNLIKADGRESILRISEKGLQILFDVNQVIFFLYNNNTASFTGYLADPESKDNPLSDLTLPNIPSSNLIADCLVHKSIGDSFGKIRPFKPSIADEQIVRLLDSEGMICIPLIVRNHIIGAIVMPVEAVQLPEMIKQFKLLSMLSDQIAMCIHVDEVKRSHTLKVQTELTEAFTMKAKNGAHEVNNSLSIIKNYLRILAVNLADIHPAQSEIRIIREEIDRVGNIMAKLSNFSQPNILEFQRVDLNMIISENMKIIQKSILAPNKVASHLNLDPSLPQVYTDKNSIKQILINLIKNAVEEMPNGGDVFIETRFVKAAITPVIGDRRNKSDHVEMMISDNGPGIRDEIKARIFEPFNSSKRDGHAGIGLSIVHRIVKELKGMITCQSEIQKGTRFSVVLPLQNPDNKKDEND